MRVDVLCTTAGLALLAAVPAAHAQTVVTSQIVDQPVQTIRTVTTVRTVRPIARHRVVVTRQTTVRDSIIPAPRAAVVLPAPAPGIAAATYRQPLYDEVTPAASDYDDGRPLYDTVVPAPEPRFVAPAPVVTNAPPALGTAVTFYRYVYQPDRILVVDPNTGVTVQSLPR